MLLLLVVWWSLCKTQYSHSTRIIFPIESEVWLCLYSVWEPAGRASHYAINMRTRNHAGALTFFFFFFFFFFFWGGRGSFFTNAELKWSFKLNLKFLAVSVFCVRTSPPCFTLCQKVRDQKPCPDPDCYSILFYCCCWYCFCFCFGCLFVVVVVVIVVGLLLCFVCFVVVVALGGLSAKRSTRSIFQTEFEVYLLCQYSVRSSWLTVHEHCTLWHFAYLFWCTCKLYFNNI